jgi:acyl dehydratase
MSTERRTDELRPMTPVQIRQERDFVASLEMGSQTYWDMVEIGDVLERDLTVTPELVILYADAVEDFNPWYEGWKMNTWSIAGSSPFGGAIVPPLMISHFVLSVQFHDTEILAPVAIGATIRISTKAIDKFEKRSRRYVRHEVAVTDVESNKLYMKEVRDILSL